MKNFNTEATEVSEVWSFSSSAEKTRMNAYKQALTDAMTRLAADPARRFVGYGLSGTPPKGALGTLAGVRPEQIVETPVAENLMVGVATGLALAGLKPVVYFERMDFMLNAADAIVNHLGALARESRGEFRPQVILRATVGNRNKQLFTGGTHTQDLTRAFQEMVGFPVCRIYNANEVREFYEYAEEESGPIMLVEYKDLM